MRSVRRRDEIYPNGQIRLKAFWRTTIADQIDKDYSAPDEIGSLCLKWLQQILRQTICKIVTNHISTLPERFRREWKGTFLPCRTWTHSSIHIVPARCLAWSRLLTFVLSKCRANLTLHETWDRRWKLLGRLW